MKLVIDEQMLTAYALNELTGEMKTQVEAYLAEHPEAAAEVESIRTTAGVLTDQLADELTAETAAAGPLPQPTLLAAPLKLKRTRRVEAMLAMAASVALVAGSVTVMIRVASNDRAKTAASLQQVGNARVLYSNENPGLFPRTKSTVGASASIRPDVVTGKSLTNTAGSPETTSQFMSVRSAGPSTPKVETRVYDIRDLIIDTPDFSDAPSFSLSSSKSPAGSGGGGGQGLFGGAAKPASDSEQDAKFDLVGKSRAELEKDATLTLSGKLATGGGAPGSGGPAPTFETGATPNIGATVNGKTTYTGGIVVTAGAKVGAGVSEPTVKFKRPAEGGNAPAAESSLSDGTDSGLSAAIPSKEAIRAISADWGSLTPRERAAVLASPKVVLRLDRPADVPDQTSNESYDRVIENEFLAAAQNPLSTFSIDVDTASYSNIRRFLTQGQMPPKDAVRIEEMVNYFPYRYETPPKGDKPFAANVEVAGCPWNAEHRLVRVGIKGKEIPANERPASNLVFLIDVSGSMNEPNKLPLVKESLRKLVNKLDARDRVAIVVYAGNSGLVLPSTQVGGFGDNEANELWHKKYVPMFQAPQGDRPVNYETISEDKARAMYVEEATQLKQQIGGKQQILAAIDRLEAGGSTNGGAGIELAYTTAASAFIKDGVNRVILATDGDWNVGVTDQGSLTRLIEDKAKGGTFLSVLGFGMGNLKDSTMERLADKGNGNYAYIDNEKEAQKVLVDQMSGTLVTIAKDVKIQVEFNPAKVGSYRLIGYEKRLLAKEDFNNDKKDAGEIGAGHTITALYEVAPIGAKPLALPGVDPLKYQPAPEAPKVDGAASNDLLTLKIRYKAPDAPLEQGTSKLLEFPVKDEGKSYQKASEDFKFAAAVASFGMVIRDSEFKGSANLNGVIELAQEGVGQDTNGYRAEFIEMVKKAKELSGK